MPAFCRHPSAYVFMLNTANIQQIYQKQAEREKYSFLPLNFSANVTILIGFRFKIVVFSFSCCINILIL